MSRLELPSLISPPPLGVACRKCMLEHSHTCQAQTFDRTKGEDWPDFPICMACAQGETCDQVAPAPTFTTEPQKPWAYRKPKPEPERLAMRKPNPDARSYHKLSNDKVTRIKFRLREGASIHAVSKEFDISDGLVGYYKRQVKKEDHPETDSLSVYEPVDIKVPTDQTDMTSGPIAVMGDELPIEEIREKRSHILIDALIDSLPPIRTTWPEGDRRRWLKAAESIIDFLYFE